MTVSARIRDIAQRSLAAGVPPASVAANEGETLFVRTYSGKIWDAIAAERRATRKGDEREVEPPDQDIDDDRMDLGDDLNECQNGDDPDCDVDDPERDDDDDLIRDDDDQEIKDDEDDDDDDAPGNRARW